MTWLKQKTKDGFRILRYALLEFFKDDGFNLAAGLSFFAILSTIPLALIVISVLGHMLGQQDELFIQVSHWVEITLPQVQPEFLSFLRQLVDKKVTSGWIGLAFLFFVASLLFSNIEHILDKVFKNSRSRNFWHSRAFSILLLIFTAFLFFVPSLLTLLASYLPATGWMVKFSGLITQDLIYFIAHGVVFFLLLEFVPNLSMPRMKIAVGAVVFALFTALAREIFRWYMGMALERYTFVYGSLTLLVVLIVWIYYLSLLFVFCAEIVSVLQGLYPEAGPLGSKTPKGSPSGKSG
jgi:membrane protein